VGSVVEEEAATEVFPSDVSEAAEAFAIGLGDGGRGFDFDSPDVGAALDDEIDFDLVFVSVVTEGEIRVSPLGLRDDLLHDEAF